MRTHEPSRARGEGASGSVPEVNARTDRWRRQENERNHERRCVSSAVAFETERTAMRVADRLAALVVAVPYRAMRTSSFTVRSMPAATSEMRASYM